MIPTDSIDLDQLVKLVLADLLGETPPCAAVGAAREKTPPSSVSVAAEKRGETPISSDAEVLSIRLTDRVITLSSVKKAQEEPSASRARRVVVSRGAIVTPSVRDELKKRNLELVVEAETPVALPDVPPFAPSILPSDPPPFATSKKPTSVWEPLRGLAPIRNRVSANEAVQGGKIPSSGGLFIAFHRLKNEPSAKSLWSDLEKDHPISFMRHDCAIEIALAVEHFMTAGSDGPNEPNGPSEHGGRAVVFTAYPAVISAVLNRRRALRALIGYDMQRVGGEIEQLGANVLVLDAGLVGIFPMQRMIRLFAAGAPRVSPAALKKGLE